MVKALVTSNIIQSVCLVGKGQLKERCGLEPQTNIYFCLRNRQKLVQIRFGCGLDSRIYGITATPVIYCIICCVRMIFKIHLKNDDTTGMSPQKKLLFFVGLHMSSLHLSLVTWTICDADESRPQNLQGNEL